ncbi:MAG: DUF4488 domain-containing protein [Pedobacter sp.]|nr:MAG: DUF4488 domain-containing protein [Pedobacter sp.]
MKRLTLRSITTLLLMFLSLSKLSAQEAKINPFEGVWELTQLATNGSGNRVPIPGLMKFFNPDGQFFNLRVTQHGALITHGGSYQINDLQTYTETVKSEVKGAFYALAGKTYKIRYTFNEDKTLLTLSGLVEGKEGVENLSYTETWKRVEMKPVNPI